MVMNSQGQAEDARCSLHDWAGLRTELLFVYDEPVPEEIRHMAGPREGELSAWLVRKGEARLETDGEVMEAKAGEWLVCFGREVKQDLARETHLLSLRILHGWTGGGTFFSGGPLQVFPAWRYPRLERLALALRKTVGRSRVASGERDPRATFLWKTRVDYLSYLKYESTLLAWMAELTRAMRNEGRAVAAPEQRDPRLAKALLILDSLPPGGFFPEDQLVHATGLTIGRLNRLTAQVYGFTMHGYWERRRVERARLALEHSSQRVKEVASDLGFVQLSHFSAWFKRNTGSSPRAFRALGRADS